MNSKLLISIVFLLGTTGFSFAKAPLHYKNDPKNINKDPNYTPGDYLVPDAFKAQTIYANKKADLAQIENQSVTLGVGEVRFNSIKNETANVPGTFRNYLGVAEFGKKTPRSMTLLIDINSMDTAVPGRNYRILSIFFESIKPELGSAVVKFDKFKGKYPSVKAMGSIKLNGVTKDISADLKIEKKNNTWNVSTAKPITLNISDFNFGHRIYDLMKECNHKSIGNRVDVDVNVFLR